MYYFNVPSALAAALVSLVSLAALGAPNTEGLRSLQQEIRLSEVKMQGALVCAANSQPCALMIKNNKNGQTFNLSDAEEAYRLYQQGQKNVAIEGMITTADTIRISRITPQ